jgi:hypothetical protein
LHVLDYLGLDRNLVETRTLDRKSIINLLRGEDACYRDSSYARAFFKDFPGERGGGIFFEKGPLCEIIYQRGIAMAEGHVWPTYHS